MSEFFNNGTVQPRPAGRIAGTNYVNELRDWVERRNPIPATGDVGSQINPPQVLRWMKVSAAADASMVALCHTWDGTNEGTQDIPVLVRPNLKSGQTIYAGRVSPSTGVSYSGKPVTWLEINGKSFMFPVGLVSDGGSAGVDKSSKCTFTYTVKNLHGDNLATHITPTGWGNGWSTLKLQLEAATSGMAYIDGDGSLKLLFWDEYPSHEQDCP